ncbi:hypothetical protein AOLI_G00200720 [Acnodon oligacanthus]
MIQSTSKLAPRDNVLWRSQDGANVLQYGQSCGDILGSCRDLTISSGASGTATASLSRFVSVGREERRHGDVRPVVPGFGTAVTVRLHWEGGKTPGAAPSSTTPFRDWGCGDILWCSRVCGNILQYRWSYSKVLRCRTSSRAGKAGVTSSGADEIAATSLGAVGVRSCAQVQTELR